MTDPQVALRERYRETLAARTLRIAELLPATRNGDPAAAQRRELLGELHTLKGEARMLGHTYLAKLCHVLEDHFRAPEPDFDALAAVLDAILLSLSPGMPEAEARELWRTSLDALGEKVADEEPSAEASAGPAPGPELPGPNAGQTRWVQVDASVVDDLCETLAALSADLGRYTARGISGEGKQSAAELDDEAGQLRARLNEALLLSLDLRLHPVEPLLARLAAHARKIAAQRGKSVEVYVNALGVRIEREILDRLGDPLLHLVQNAVEHGVESPGERGSKAQVARLELLAETSGAMVTIRIKDDGRGIDRDAVFDRARREGRIGSRLDVSLDQLDVLFQPGFSTREQVDEGAGRGVGLDVVRRMVEALGGSVGVESELRRGTTFSLSIPAALTQERLVVIQTGDVLYGISSRLVVSIERIEQQEKVAEGSTFFFREQTLPLCSLAAMVGAPSPEEERTVLVLTLGEKLYALSCAGVVEHSELLRRPTSRSLASHSGVSASAELEDGRLVLLLDPSFLRQGVSRKAAPGPKLRVEAGPSKPRVLVVDDSVVVRDLLSEVLVTAGYHVESAADGKEALALMASFEPALVISDIEMPEMDGFGLLRAIRSQSDTLPVVLVTARSSAEDRRKASSLGASAYVAKGEFRSESLINVVERYLPEGL